MKLNLGAADRHISDFLCVDIAPPPCPFCDAGIPLSLSSRTVDLSLDWPWADSSIEEIMALDVVEHLPDRIHTMNELHRVLRPGGRVTIETPNAGHGVGFFQDPQHISPFCLSTFKYFEHRTFAWDRLHEAYGITAAFKSLSLNERYSNGEDGREDVWKIVAILQSVK